MHLSRIFNEYGLFQHMNGWNRKYVEESNTNQYLIKEFLFRASSAYLSINRMNMLSINCVNEYRRQKSRLKLNNNRILFWTPTVIEILSEMSPFLSTLRILQNNIFRLAANEYNPHAHVPKSLNDAIKKGLRHLWVEWYVMWTFFKLLDWKWGKLKIIGIWISIIMQW